MNFRNPPIAEIWISFSFAPNEAKTEWDLTKVGQFLERYRGELPRIERATETELQVQETSAAELPRVIGLKTRVKFARASSPDRSHILHVADDELAFHVVKRGTTKPRFSAVKEAITPKLLDYISAFQPVAVQRAVIHYLDIIDIPVPEVGIIELKDYFPFLGDLPENPFGHVKFVTQQFVTDCPSDEGALHLQVRTLPSPAEQRVFRFRVDWQKHAVNVDTLEFETIWERLNRSHQFLRKCFQTFLAKSTLDLFDPVSEH